MRDWFGRQSFIKKAGLIFATAITGLVIIGIAAGPASTKPVKVNPAALETSQPTVTTKTITENETIPFETQSVQDPNTQQGQTVVKQEGRDGQKQKTFEITYNNGSEVSRKVTGETVVLQPVPKIIANGTKVPQPALSNNNSYTNVDGNQVHSPASSTNGQVPAGATARCSDGSYSFSQHRQGTCSYHGGVAQWL